MFKKWLSLPLVGWMLASTPIALAQTSGQTNDQTAAQTNNDPQIQQAKIAKIKAQARHILLGDSTHATIELLDKTKLSGDILEVGEDHLVLREVKTGQDTQVPYAKVNKLHGSNRTALKLVRIVALGAGENHPKGTLIFVGILFGGILALLASDKS